MFSPAQNSQHLHVIRVIMVVLQLDRRVERNLAGNE